MKNVIRRDDSSVLLPKDEYTYLTLDAQTSNSAPALKLIKFDSKTQLTKGVVMGYPLRMPLALLQRLPQVEEAMRCITPRLKEETRQVIVTVRGTLSPNLDMGNWEVFYLRPYTPEPLRCFRCQQFGHHQNNCSCTPACGICSRKHVIQQCLDEYKTKHEVTHKCPNGWEGHHAWNHSCPARLQRVTQGRERQVSWVQDQQRTAMIPGPLGTFIWG